MLAETESRRKERGPSSSSRLGLPLLAPIGSVSTKQPAEQK